MLETVPPKVSGVNFVGEMLKVWLLTVGLKTVTTKDVDEMVGTRPKLAETANSHVVPPDATERSSRPAPCAVGPMSCVPVLESLITRVLRFTSADFTCAGDQFGLRPSSTAAEPAMCGVAIEVPLKNAHE